MRLNTLRNCFTVVSCQLARLRLLATAQAMKAALETGGSGNRRPEDDGGESITPYENTLTDVHQGVRKLE